MMLLPKLVQKKYLRSAQKMLGHSDIGMTLAIYIHATDGMQDAATAALEEAFSRTGC